MKLTKILFKLVLLSFLGMLGINLLALFLGLPVPSGYTLFLNFITGIFIGNYIYNSEVKNNKTKERVE